MGFNVELIPDDIKQTMLEKKTWVQECPVKLTSLRLLNIEHYNFEGIINQGQIIVHQRMAENAVNIFKELFEIKFPINQIKLIDEYNGNDGLSMADNNSSCFNCRKVEGSDKFSVHAYGLAIDLNPLQNPVIVLDKENQSVLIHPKAGIEFLNRNNQREGMVEPVVEIFKKHGFDIWGGNWNDPIDYHHFQVTRQFAEELAGLDAEILN